jgi:hypothetical protein
MIKVMNYHLLLRLFAKGKDLVSGEIAFGDVDEAEKREQHKSACKTLEFSFA